MTKQELVKLAIEAYAPNTEYPHDGDTLALFVEREIGDADGDAEAAELMIDVAISDLTRVLYAMQRASQ